MKTFFFLIISIASAGALAATDADLDNCTSESNPQLCMSKVLLAEIQQRPGHGGGGGGGGGHTLGVIRFYRDDGRCTSSVIGQVFVTLDEQTNRSICRSATSSGDVWGVGVDVGGAVTCYDIQDTSRASSACEEGMRRAGVPL